MEIDKDVVILTTIIGVTHDPLEDRGNRVDGYLKTSLLKDFTDESLFQSFAQFDDSAGQ